MSMDLLVRLPDPEEIKKKYPASEKVKEIEGFYKSLSLLNDDMMNLTEYLSDI